MGRRQLPVSCRIDEQRDVPVVAIVVPNEDAERIEQAQAIGVALGQEAAGEHALCCVPQLSIFPTYSPS